MNLRQRLPREENEPHRRYDDLTGRRFGILTAVSYEGRSRRTALWKVRCDCGTEKNVKRSDLLRGQQSCGCLVAAQVSARFTTHGLTRPGNHHPLYSVFKGMIERCHSPVCGAARYQGRGIIVCDRWRFGEAGKEGFECFLADMGPRPSKDHSIDRKDNDGNYEPGNCRWATQLQQQRNRSSNRRVEFRGSEMTLTEAIQLSGLNRATVWGRLHLGWSIIDALETPLVRPWKKNA